MYIPISKQHLNNVHNNFIAYFLIKLVKRHQSNVKKLKSRRHQNQIRTNYVIKVTCDFGDNT